MHLLVLCEHSEISTIIPNLSESVRQLLYRGFAEIEKIDESYVAIVNFGNSPGDFRGWEPIRKNSADKAMRGKTMGVPNVNFAISKAATIFRDIPEEERVMVLFTYVGSCDYDEILTQENMKYLPSYKILVVCYHADVILPKNLKIGHSDIFSILGSDEEYERFACRLSELSTLDVGKVHSSPAVTSMPYEEITINKPSPSGDSTPDFPIDKDNPLSSNYDEYS